MTDTSTLSERLLLGYVRWVSPTPGKMMVEAAAELDRLTAALQEEQSRAWDLSAQFAAATAALAEAEKKLKDAEWEASDAEQQCDKFEARALAAEAQLTAANARIEELELSLKDIADAWDWCTEDPVHRSYPTMLTDLIRDARALIGGENG